MKLREYAIYFAWVVSLSGLLLSLYFGEVLNLEPCRLCWYQRIALFPLALFLGIATYKDDRKIALYSIPLVLFGLVMAFYQSIIAYFPSMHTHTLCGHEGHCTLPIFYLFGFISFPVLSMLGFAAIAILLIFSQKAPNR